MWKNGELRGFYKEKKKIWIKGRNEQTNLRLEHEGNY